MTREAVESCVVPGRHELPPVSGVSYGAFTDPAGGSGADSMTLVIAHAETRDGRTVAVLDALREHRPPFSPEAVVAELAALLQTYRVTTFGGEWPREAFRKHGVDYRPAEAVKSDLYRDLLPLLNSGAGGHAGTRRSSDQSSRGPPNIGSCSHSTDRQP